MNPKFLRNGLAASCFGFFAVASWFAMAAYASHFPERGRSAMWLPATLGLAAFMHLGIAAANHVGHRTPAWLGYIPIGFVAALLAYRNLG
ncbi:hypothetical protein N789_05900 [Arenimonas oryziterrae DSM 21050 = YC6267]|uniref:Cyd operon protein YbgE n=1 Tax=Arenimonas oryziterrae DSM 21050 = YC6267 TaxID=1121015 RepID=A0A091AMI3_9GAMM|nr:hypothetical protein N789_05900 [Arenimonas oryziterrae DSM 21050 = YC6267]